MPVGFLAPTMVFEFGVRVVVAPPVLADKGVLVAGEEREDNGVRGLGVDVAVLELVVGVLAVVIGVLVVVPVFEGGDGLAAVGLAGDAAVGEGRAVAGLDGPVRGEGVGRGEGFADGAVVGLVGVLADRGTLGTVGLGDWEVRAVVFVGVLAAADRLTAVDGTVLPDAGREDVAGAAERGAAGRGARLVRVGAPGVVLVIVLVVVTRAAGAELLVVAAGFGLV